MTYKDLVESGIRFIQSFLYVRCINRRSLILRKKKPRQVKDGNNVEGEEMLQQEDKPPKSQKTGDSDEIVRTESMTTEQWNEREKVDAMEKQAYFNQLSIAQKRKWYGALRKSFVEFKVKRKEFAVDHSKLDTAKEIEFLTERMDSFVLRCKAFAKNIDDIHELTEKILREQEVLLSKLDFLNEHLENFDEIQLESKTVNTAVYNASEEIYEKPQFEHVSEGRKLP